MNYDVMIITDVVRLEEKRLIEEAQNSGLRILLVNLSSKGFEIGEEALAPFALIRAISMYKSLYSASFLEASGCRAINNSLSILLAGDKALSLPLFYKAGIPIPPTFLALSPETAINYIATRQKPLIDKPPIGSWGRLVSFIDSDITAKIVVEHREEIPSPQLKAHLIQDYIRINGEDIRCFVVRGEIVACMKRKAQPNEWRTNVAMGAYTEPFTPTDIVSEISIKAIETIKADYGSVDIGMDKITGKYYLFEVNGVPEFKGLEKTTKANIARAIINIIKR